MRQEIPLEAPAAQALRKVQVSVLESPQEEEVNWKCFRCGYDMYAVVGPDGAKATCSSCSQYVDSAQCSNPECRDTKCLPCYNRALIKTKPSKPSAPLVSDESEF